VLADFLPTWLFSTHFMSRLIHSRQIQIVVCDNDAAKDWKECDKYKAQRGSDPRAL
jgi:hypothetical protein